MQITNVEVYGLKESFAAAKLPMNKEFHAMDFGDLITSYDSINSENAHRQFTLADTYRCSGHPNFLKGIVVQANYTATIKWWTQAQRYTFFTIVSSQSTMHRLKDMELADVCSEKVHPAMLEVAEQIKSLYLSNEIDFGTFIDSMPLGIRLTARVTTNYLCLRNMYMQRKDHKYYEWENFCRFIKSLPYSDKLITIEDHTNAEENLYGTGSASTA